MPRVLDNLSTPSLVGQTGGGVCAYSARLLVEPEDRPVALNDTKCWVNAG